MPQAGDGSPQAIMASNNNIPSKQSCVKNVFQG